MKGRGRHTESERIEEILPSTETIPPEAISKFEQLKEAFPTIKEDDVFMTLNSYDWDADAATTDLQKQAAKKGKKGKKTSSAAATAPAAAAPAKKASTAPVKKPTIQRAPKAAAPAPVAAAPAPAPAPAPVAAAPAVQPIDAGLMLNISKSLEEQIAEVQRQAALLVSIKERLAEATKTGNEAVEKLKKELAELEAEEKRVNARLETTRKKLATIDDKIAQAEKDKDVKVNAFINSCKDKGIKVKL